MAARLVCTFSLGTQTFGVDVRSVQEVVRGLQLTRVPLAPAEVAGLINLRGEIVTAIDLRRRLGMEPPPEHGRTTSVIVRSGDGALVSLMVDEIGDVVEVGDAAFEHTPETVQGPIRQLITGVFKLEDSLLLSLDVERAVDVAPRTSAARSEGG